MSHSHTHAPGEDHNHSHGPPQQPQAPQLDPLMQAIIEQDFVPVPITLGDPENSTAHCAAHKLEKCAECDVDFVNLNRLARLLQQNPTLACPPPPNVISQKLSQMFTTAKDEGNRLFKSKRTRDAIQQYQIAASIASQRPPWEASQFMREELSTVVSNRSAAFLDSSDVIGALIDAETVIQLRRNWSKGHFRKAKALLAMGEYEEAKETLRLGLQFEPDNAELNGFFQEIDKGVERMRAELEAKRVAAE